MTLRGAMMRNAAYAAVEADGFRNRGPVLSLKRAGCGEAPTFTAYRSRVRSCHDRKRFLLPRCYQTIPHHADPRRTPSVPSVEIFELCIAVDLGGDILEITLN